MIKLVSLLILSSFLNWNTKTSSVENLTLNCKVFVPNVFSPNEDGVNDTFNAATPCNIASFKMKIFNRWGRLIFETENPDQGWNGIANGSFQPIDSYVYTIEITFPEVSNKPEIISGSVQLLR